MWKARRSTLSTNRIAIFSKGSPESSGAPFGEGIPALLQALVAEKVLRIGQLEIERREGGFVLSHRDDAGRSDLRDHEIEDAFEIARFDDAGNYRPLKTAPTLRHGWKIFGRDLLQVERVIDTIYPGLLAMLRAFK